MISLAIALGFPLLQQMQDGPPPPACIGPTFVSWEACAAATASDSAIHRLALANLGTEAYVQGDLATALAYYDRAERPGQSMSSDVLFHTFRGDARRYGGRMDEALRDALIAWGYLDGRPPAGIAPADVMPLNNELRALVLSLILPILKDGESADFQRARDLYVSLPAGDWVALSQRAGALSSLGEHATAVAASESALSLRPSDPMTQNNHCYVLSKAGQAAEGLAFCERAVAAAPAEAAYHHSYATVLAALGRCADAEVQITEARRLDPVSAEHATPLECDTGV